MVRQQQRIAEMLMSADNRVSHYGQPHMLPMHGGQFHLQGYSNPYDYPSTLGAGRCMEGGAMSGGINWKKIGNQLVSGLGQATSGLTKMGLSYGMGRSGGARSGGNIFGKLGKVATQALQKVAPRLIEEGMKYAMGGARSGGAMMTIQPAYRPYRPHISHLTEDELPRLYQLKKNEIKALHGAGFFGDLGKIATGVIGQVVDKAGPKLIDAGLQYALGGGARSGGQQSRYARAIQLKKEGYSVGNSNLHTMNGAGFWGDLGKIATGVVGQVVDKAGPKLIDEGLKYALGGARSGGATLPASGRLRNTARGDIVRAIMVQRGVNLPTASKIVKQEGLY